MVEADHIPPKDSFKKLWEHLKNYEDWKNSLREKNMALYKVVMRMEKDPMEKGLICMNTLYLDHRRVQTGLNTILNSCLVMFIFLTLNIS